MSIALTKIPSAATHGGELQQIVMAAVRATGYLMAAIFVEDHSDFRLVESFVASTNVSIALVDGPRSVCGEASDKLLYVVNDPQAEEDRLKRYLYIDGRPHTGSAVAAMTSMHEGQRVVLVVVNDALHGGLSAAQGYCLQAYVAHIATLLEADSETIRVAVHDRRNKQRVQNERLRLLESVAVHARDSIIITEAEPTGLPGPRIIYCNAAFTATTGYTEAETVGRTPRMLQGPKTDPASRAKLREMLLAWSPIEIELLNYKKDGTEFWVELSIVPVADDRGWYTHWVSVQRDITERKAANELKTRIQIAELENAALEVEIQERKRVEVDLLYTAFHDSLTGLRNRAFFMERLSTTIRRSKDTLLNNCAVLFLDLDRFKAVNDSLGHGVGDTLLIEVAHRLTQCTRPQDTLARIGGDEFALLIEDADDLTIPVGIAERIIERLRAPVRLGRQDVYPSCSIGVVQASADCQVGEDLVRDADIAMYRAKRSGRGDYAIFTTSMRSDAIAALTLQTDLRHALERKEFLLHYQPVVEPVRGETTGFEALIRWQHPTRGLVYPADFVPMAEEMALIYEIDRRALREACLQLRAWQSDYHRPTLRMSVNASAGELTQPTYVGDLIATLRETGVDPRSLEIEITEGLFLHPSSTIEATLKSIRALGVRIGLDDFGTGYSCLSYINRYPIDTIKIDQSFVALMCTQPTTRAIVELIIKLGVALNVGIVAEGVETGEQAKMLAQMGCLSAQGYHFARPLPPAAAATFISPLTRLRAA